MIRFFFFHKASIQIQYNENIKKNTLFEQVFMYTNVDFTLGKSGLQFSCMSSILTLLELLLVHCQDSQISCCSFFNYIHKTKWNAGYIVRDLVYEIFLKFYSRPLYHFRQQNLSIFHQRS